MVLRFINAFAVVAFFVCAGCGEAEQQPPATAAASASNSMTSAASPAETIARIHWMGKRQIAADTNSHDLMRVWNLPESGKLERQTIDKLSQSPRLLTHQPVNSSASEALKPLLEDVLHEESYSEIQTPTRPGTGALVFAIKLNPTRTALWQTNLASALQSLTGIKVETSKSGGWSLKKHDFPNFIQFARIGDWTLVGAAQESNPLFVEISNRLRSKHTPYPAIYRTNTWLEAELDVPRVAHMFFPAANLPANTPKLSLSITGNGEYVKTRGDLDFPKPLGMASDPWNIPTNMIHGELTTFTAARGIGECLDSLSWWQNLKMGSAPNQVFCWGVSGLPAQIYCAAPIEDASNRVDRVADRVLSLPMFTNNELAGFQKSPSFHGIIWKGLPYLYPFLKAVPTGSGNFVEMGTVVVEGNDTVSPQPELIKGLLARTNLVYYDREFTGGQIEQWIFISQFARFVSHQAQLPQNAAGLLWLKAAVPIVGSSGTDIAQSGPARLSFTRTSGIGFTSIELNLLIDWLESPDFPLGLHTFRAKPESQP